MKWNGLKRSSDADIRSKEERWARVFAALGEPEGPKGPKGDEEIWVLEKLEQLAELLRNKDTQAV
jgi:hypothetical protein